MGGAGDFSYLEMYTFPPPPGFRILLIGALGVIGGEFSEIRLRQASGSSSLVPQASSVVNFPKSDFAADGGGSKIFYPCC